MLSLVRSVLRDAGVFLLGLLFVLTLIPAILMVASIAILFGSIDRED